MAITPSSFKTRPVTVLGAGVLGRRIACIWAAGGYEVRIRDPSAEQRNAALLYVETSISSYATELGTTPGKVSAHEDLAEAVKDAWTVIEAVPEKIGLKIAIFLELEKLAEKDALLVSNSSSYKSHEMVGGLREETRRRILNTHYFMPPSQRLVELMTDGETDPEIFPFYVERLKEVGMHPIVAKKESTGFVMNRIWAALKRETLMELSEGVCEPEELDRAFMEMFGTRVGPCALMDMVGLDTVALIEEHYVKERGLSPEHTVDFLKKNYISKGLLGAKCGKGGLYPAAHTTNVNHTTPRTPTLYILESGLNTFPDPLHSGRIVIGSPDGKELRTIVSGQSLPDGLDISLKTERIYWTSMGIPTSNDGMVQSCKLDGSDIQTVIKRGDVHTPKQLTIDQENDKLYFCDREGLRVMRCNFDGSEHEILVQNGEWNNKEDAENQLNWPVGITVNQKEGKFYWTQKGGSKSGKGRIFRASLVMPKGETPSNRSDIELLFTGLPEPIDLEIEKDTQTLFWTDRGDPPFGNSLNSAQLNGLKGLKAGEKNPGHEILTRQLHEAIGLRIDDVNKQIYMSDLGGTVYRVDMDGKNKKKLYDVEFPFTGISLAHV